MKHALLILLLFFATSITKSQSSLAVTHWKFDTVSQNDTLVVEFNVKLDEGWHIYSQYMEGDGPVPTSFVFDKNEKIVLDGKVTEEKSITEYDPNFDMEVSYFKHQTIFRQKIKKTGTDKTTLTGTIEFMVCNDTMCYPPDTLEFKIELH